MRVAALATVLVAVYVAGLGLEPRGGEAYLRTAETLLDHGEVVRGSWGVGFPLLIAPAYAVAGARGVEVFLAAIAALAGALAYRLALRVAPDPWALGA